MIPDERERDTIRVRDEVTGRLRRAGITTTGADSPEELVRLLDAVEEFERTVDNRGGDLMVDEPIGSQAPKQPDDVAFVLPVRDKDEPVEAFIRRIDAARNRAARVRET